MTWPALCASALLPASVLAALTCSAPTSHAAPAPISVSAYLQTLSQARLPIANPGRVVDLGNRVCQQSRGGTGFDDLAQSVIGDGFTPGEAGLIMGAAVGTIC